MPNSAVVGILRALLTASTAEFELAMKRSADTAKGFSRDLRKIGTEVSAIGSSLTKTLTLPIAGLGLGVAKLAMDFESSFAGVKKTVNASEAEFAQMAQAFRNLSKEIPVNVNEMNRLGESAGALGIPKAQIVDFARVMAELGVTTNVTSDQAADSIAKIQNIFGAAGQNTEQFASTLVDLGNNGASTESEILELTKRIAAAGHTVGLSQAQVLGFASAIANVGMEAEAGGSAMSRVFNDISLAVSKGGSALGDFARVAGMSSEAFAKAFRENAAAATTEFIAGLGRIQRGGGDLIRTLGELGFTELRQADLLKRLAGSGDNLADSLQVANRAWEQNTALTAEAQKRFETTASRLTVLWNRIKDVGITLGTALTPAINQIITLLEQLLPYVDRLAAAFTNLPTSVQTTAIGLLALAAAAGPVLVVVGQVITAMSTIVGSFSKTGVAFRALMALFGEGGALAGIFAGALELLTGPIGWIVGIGSAILTATGTWGDFFRILKAGAEIIGTIVVWAFTKFIQAGEWVIGILGRIVSFVDDIFGISTGLQAMGRAFQTAMGWAADSLERLSKYMKGVPSEADAAAAALERLRQAGMKPMASHGGTPAAPGAAPSVQLPAPPPTFTAQLKAAQAEIDKLSTSVRADLVKAIQSGAFEMKDLQEQSHLSELALKLFKEQVEKSAAATKKSSEALEAWKKATAEVTAYSGNFYEVLQTIDGAVVEGAKAYLRRGEDLKNIATMYQLTEAQLKAVQQQLTLEEMVVRAGTDAYNDYVEKLELAARVRRESANAGFVKNLGAEQAALKSSSDMRRKTSLTDYEYQVALIQDEAAEKKRALDETSANYQAALDAIAEETDLKMQVAAAAWKQHLEEMNRETNSWGNLTKKWLDAIPQLLQQAFTGGGGAGGAGKALASMVGSDIGGRLMGDLAAHASNFFVNTFGKKTTEMLNTLLPGIGSVIGSLAGPMLGKIADALTTSPGEDVMYRVGRNWGVKISEGMGDQIAKDAKELFHGSRQAAEIFNFKKIFDEAGGVTSSNFSTAIARFRDLFSMIETGQMTVAQGAKVIDENWSSLLAAGTDSFGFIDKRLREIIELDRRFGTQSKEVAAFLKAQGDAAISASNDVIASLGPQLEGWQDLSAKIADAKKEGKDFKDLLKQQQALATANKDSLENMGIIALATFSAAIAAGKSFSEALQAAGPGLQQLSDAFKALGVDTDNAALKALMLQATLLKNNPALIQGVAGLGQAFVALSNMGLLNVDTFRAMEKTGLQMYTKLQGEVAATGGSTKDALLPMQDYLHRAQKAAEELGIPLDENTQMLIDQSKELGIWREAGKSATDKVLGGINDLVSAVKDLINQLLGIPSVNYTVTETRRTDYQTTGTPPGPPPKGNEEQNQAEGAWTGGLVNAFGRMQRFSAGGQVGGNTFGSLFGTPLGLDSVPVWTMPGELILNESQKGTLGETLRAGADLARQIGAAGAAGGDQIHVGAIHVQVVTDSDDPRQLADQFAEMLRTQAVAYDAVTVVSKRAAGVA